MARQQEQTKRHTKFDERSGKIQQNLETSLDTSATPPEFKQATLNAYQLIALCLCNKLTPTLTYTPSKQIAGSMEVGLLPFGAYF